MLSTGYMRIWLNWPPAKQATKKSGYLEPVEGLLGFRSTPRRNPNHTRKPNPYPNPKPMATYIGDH